MSRISRWREWRDRKANRNFSIASAKTGLLASERSGFEYAEPDAEGERAVLGVEVVRETIQAVELRPYLDPAVFARMVGPWEAVTGVALRR
jgi:hypothetical protein